MASARDRDVDPRALVLCLLVVLVFVTRVLLQVDDRVGDDYEYHTLLLPVDLVLVAVLVLGLRELPAAIREWKSHAASLGGLALGVALVPALVAHPSDRGFAAVLRWTAVCSAGLLFTRLGGPERRAVIWVLAGATALSALVAFGQRIVDGPVGLKAIGEVDMPVIDIGAPAVSGMLVHPYVMGAWVVVVVTALAAFAMSGRWTPGAAGLGVLFVVAAPLGMSMARSAAIAGIAVGAVLTVAAVRHPDPRRAAPLVGVVVAGFALGALLNANGWVNRAEVSTGRSVDVTAGRGQLMDQAREMFDEHPVVGVGPGRYVIALSERPEIVAISRQTPRPVHNVPILWLVEGGLLVLPGLIVLLLGIGWATWRAGLPGLAVVAAYVPFMLLDHLGWSFPQGLVLTGLWLGVLDVLARPKRRLAADAPDA